MTTTSEQILEIEDALVSDANPARTDGPLDYERCARLHNYLVAQGWMASHERDTPDLEEMAREPWIFSDEDINAHGDGFFYWVSGPIMQLADEFILDDNDLEDLERFVIIYDTVCDLGGHTMGVVYDQQRHRAAFPIAIESCESVEPIDEHEDVWFPLETLLTNWVHMFLMGKVTASPSPDRIPRELQRQRHQLGIWSWNPYCPSQVNSTVEAMDCLTTAIEERMPPGSLLPISPDTPLFTDAELNAASIPQDCFIRSFLTRVRTPRFRMIAPGLEVPHDSEAFTARQKFTGLPRDPEIGVNIPSVVIFAAADTSRTIDFGKGLRWLFFHWDDPVPYNENEAIPTGLYSESLCRSDYDTEEGGFRLVLPFGLESDCREDGARMSDGGLITPGSHVELFQHGVFHQFGGERRAQRLERVLDRWRELVESGVWAVGNDGVQGGIEKFQDAARGAWQDYWIPPSW